MKKYIVFIALTIFFVSCEKENPKIMYEVKGEAEIIDSENLPPTQQLAFGAFDKSGLNLKTHTNLEAVNDSMYTFSTDLEEGDYTFKIIITENDIHKSDLHIFNESALTDSLLLFVSDLQILTFKTIQRQVFNRCTQCHGLSTEIAGGLNLLEGESYDNLINVPSENSAKPRVEPGNATNSYLVQVLNKQDLNFDHSASTTATPGDIELVKKWINEGALNYE